MDMGRKRDEKELAKYLDQEEKIFLHTVCRNETAQGVLGVTQNRIIFLHKPLLQPAIMEANTFEAVDYVRYTEGTGEGELAVHLNNGDIRSYTSHQLIHLKGVSDIIRMYVNDHQRDTLFRNTFNRKRFY